MSNRKYIATKLHQLLEVASSDPAGDLVINAMVDLPHYVIDQRLVEMFMREDLLRSIAAVIEAGIARLPFPEVVVEFETQDEPGTHGTRRFVRLVERGGAIIADVVSYLPPVVTVTTSPIELTIATEPEPGLQVGAAASKADQVSAAFATMVSFLMMLNIQGIEREHVDPTRFNVARSKAGRPNVPRHTILRIGTVVDRNGDPAHRGGARNMPVHLRSGHVRHQAYGPERTLRKLVYIPPVLVNFVPGEDDGAGIKHPKRILTK